MVARVLPWAARATRPSMARGDAGVVWHRYQVAARLGPWTLRRTIDGAAIEAAIVDVDETWLAREPLTLTLGIGSIEWEWDIVAPLVQGGALTVSVSGGPARSAPRGTRLTT